MFELLWVQSSFSDSDVPQSDDAVEEITLVCFDTGVSVVSISAACPLAFFVCW